jgi:hypothetical protein
MNDQIRTCTTYTNIYLSRNEQVKRMLYIFAQLKPISLFILLLQTILLIQCF